MSDDAGCSLKFEYFLLDDPNAPDDPNFSLEYFFHTALLRNSDRIEPSDFNIWKFQAQALTFAMGTHHRLGTDSLMHELVEDVLVLVMRCVERSNTPLSEEDASYRYEDRRGYASDDSWMDKYAGDDYDGDDSDEDADGCNLDEQDEFDLAYSKFEDI